jgi:acetyl esterase/lipase
VIYLHGGGFVVGDLDSHDGICRRLARTADVAVLAVAYRLAPEYPAPAAVDDAVSAFIWAVSPAPFRPCCWPARTPPGPGPAVQVPEPPAIS